MLTKSYGANCLYLIYHRELPAVDARQVFTWWRKACTRKVEIAPTLVLSVYDKPQTTGFATNELGALADFFREKVNPQHLAVYDVSVRQQPPSDLVMLAQKSAAGLIGLGPQPGESLDAFFIAGVDDTWSAPCYGKGNEWDWLESGFGVDTLRQWVLERNPGMRQIAWGLVAVAWDYSATERGGYPGYDDSQKHMPLPAGRNRAAVELIRETANAKQLAGFNSDLSILHANSLTTPHDGRTHSFYQCLKRGEDCRGYYGTPFQEIATLYRELSDRNY